MDNLLKGFRADIMGAILHHRTHNDSRNPIDPFVATVELHRARYLKKLNESVKTGGATEAMADEAKGKIAKMADAEIKRIRDVGVVEFVEA